MYSTEYPPEGAYDALIARQNKEKKMFLVRHKLRVSQMELRSTHH